MLTAQETLSPHLAIIAGPDTGLCLGSGVIGRARGITDSYTSRAHLHFTCSQDPKHRARIQLLSPLKIKRKIGPLWLSFPLLPTALLGSREQKKFFFLRPNQQIHVGLNTFEYRLPHADFTFPLPPNERKNIFASLIPFLSIIFLFPVFSRFFLPTLPESIRAKAPWIFISLLLFLLIRLLKPRQIYDAAALVAYAPAYLPAAAQNEKTWKANVWLSKAQTRLMPLKRDLRFPKQIEIRESSNIYLHGPHAHECARWIAAQLLLQGKVHVIEELGTRKTLQFFCTQNYNSLKILEITTPDKFLPKTHPQLIISPSSDQTPSGIQQNIPAPHVALSPAWWKQLTGDVELFPNREEKISSFTQTPQLPLQARPSARQISKNWKNNTPHLKIPLGVSESGKETSIDLTNDGPHALVGGTSGSGKSETLLTWIALLCAQHSPQQLQLVLIDYKGGSTFKRIKDLPHVIGVLTDLEAGETTRAIKGLEYELERREKLFYEVHTPDYDSYIRQNPCLLLPRIIIVVDELKELSQKNPHELDSLNRLAAQGRSLGLHLILATQRPAGAITSEIRANSQIKIALRVTTSTDSYEILENDHAMHLPPFPGNAIINRGEEEKIKIYYLPPTNLKELVQACQIASKKSLAKNPIWYPALPAKMGYPHTLEANKLAIAMVDLHPGLPPKTAFVNPGQITLIASNNIEYLENFNSLIRNNYSGYTHIFHPLAGDYLAGDSNEEKYLALLSEAEKYPGTVLFPQAQETIQAMNSNYLSTLRFEHLIKKLSKAQNRVILTGNIDLAQLPIRQLAHSIFIQGELDALTHAKLALPGYTRDSLPACFVVQNNKLFPATLFS
ncbi:hypothetical protein KRX54_03920 [Actinomycetaceae bacterium TAE3-ERU4]|nr:hypothetical protein [Actinomycetaceae bacterium TAE3-ERU4]